MASARPLRDVFNELTGSGSGDDSYANETLAAHGHPDLPEGLVAEAVVNYADTAPVEVAEHLAPFVMAHSAVYPQAGAPDTWLDALATTPEPLLDADPVPLVEATDATEADRDIDPADLDFGVGDHAGVAGPVPELDTPLWTAPEVATLDEFGPAEPAEARLEAIEVGEAESTDLDVDDIDEAV